MKRSKKKIIGIVFLLIVMIISSSNCNSSKKILLSNNTKNSSVNRDETENTDNLLEEVNSYDTKNINEFMKNDEITSVELEVYTDEYKKTAPTKDKTKINEIVKYLKNLKFEKVDGWLIPTTNLNSAAITLEDKNEKKYQIIISADLVTARIYTPDNPSFEYKIYGYNAEELSNLCNKIGLEDIIEQYVQEAEESETQETDNYNTKNLNQFLNNDDIVRINAGVSSGVITQNKSEIQFLFEYLKTIKVQQVEERACANTPDSVINFIDKNKKEYNIRLYGDIAYININDKYLDGNYKFEKINFNTLDSICKIINEKENIKNASQVYINSLINRKK